MASEMFEGEAETVAELRALPAEILASILPGCEKAMDQLTWWAGQEHDRWKDDSGDTWRYTHADVVGTDETAVHMLLVSEMHGRSGSGAGRMSGGAGGYLELATGGRDGLDGPVNLLEQDGNTGERAWLRLTVASHIDEIVDYIAETVLK